MLCYLSFEFMIEILLYISIFWLIGTGCILIWNAFNFSKIADQNSNIPEKPLISVCIPARNEESSLPRCLQSILVQNYENFDVWVLNDHSTDNTREIAEAFRANYSNLTVINGSEKPKDWLGKPWACHQLSRHAKGDLLLFLDADTWLEPDALAKLASAFHSEKLDALTVWPGQHFGTRTEKTILPLVYYVLVTLLPAGLVKFSPRFGPKKLREQVRTALSAGCGQCFAFTREAYQKIGGHESVKGKVVEDVELAKLLRKKDLKLQMYNGINVVSCRMYKNHEEIWQGLRKNFFAGFGYNFTLFFTAALLHFVVFILPPVFLIYSLVISNLYVALLSTLALLLMLIHRFILSKMFKWDLVFSLTHVPAVLWFQLLALRCAYDRLNGTNAVWKGRKI